MEIIEVGIKLKSHTMTIWEKVVAIRLREETEMSENQFGFMTGKSTIEPMYCVRQSIEKYKY